MVDKTTFTVNASNLTMRIQQAEMYLKEFENEVKRANGATGIFRSKEDALSRIKILNEFAPDDPRIQDLFATRIVIESLETIRCCKGFDDIVLIMIGIRSLFFN